MKADRTTKLIEDYTVNDASFHDSQAVEDLAEDDDGILHADSAYTGEAIGMILEENGVKGEICEKGYRNHPLTEAQKKRNRKKSKIRVRVEHIFGFMTNSMRWVEDERDRDETDCRRDRAIESGVQHGPIRTDPEAEAGVGGSEDEKTSERRNAETEKAKTCGESEKIRVPGNNKWQRDIPIFWK